MVTPAGALLDAAKLASQPQKDAIFWWKCLETVFTDTSAYTLLTQRLGLAVRCVGHASALAFLKVDDVAAS
jgi:hypothetical protein